MSIFLRYNTTYDSSSPYIMGTAIFKFKYINTHLYIYKYYFNSRTTVCTGFETLKNLIYINQYNIINYIFLAIKYA